jgi:hypothetical protein
VRSASPFAAADECVARRALRAVADIVVCGFQRK